MGVDESLSLQTFLITSLKKNFVFSGEKKTTKKQKTTRKTQTKQNKAHKKNPYKNYSFFKSIFQVTEKFWLFLATTTNVLHYSKL